jgi:hypothetical protein
MKDHKKYKIKEHKNINQRTQKYKSKEHKKYKSKNTKYKTPKLTIKKYN